MIKYENKFIQSPKLVLVVMLGKYWVWERNCRTRFWQQSCWRIKTSK